MHGELQTRVAGWTSFGELSAGSHVLQEPLQIRPQVCIDDLLDNGLLDAYHEPYGDVL